MRGHKDTRQPVVLQQGSERATTLSFNYEEMKLVMTQLWVLCVLLLQLRTVAGGPLTHSSSLTSNSNDEGRRGRTALQLGKGEGQHAVHILHAGC